MATLDELVVRIRADASQLESELRRVQGTTRQAASGMSKSLGELKKQFLELLPALTLAAVVEVGRRAVEAASHITDLAKQIGFAAGTLSALEEGLVTSGASLDQFASAVNLMNANIGQAASGNEEMVKNFDALGISVRKLQQLTPEEQFYALVKALSQVKDQYQQTDLGRSIFGRGFTALLPLIKESNGQIAEFVKRQQEMGKALNDEQLDHLTELANSFSRVALTLRNDLLKAINDTTEGFLRLFNVASDPNAADLQKQIDEYKAELAKPASLRPKDRMGNLREPDAYINQQITRLQGQLAVQQEFEARQGKGPKKPGTPADAKGSNAGLIKGTNPGTVLPPDYDSSEFQKYLNDLRNETEALTLSGRALEIRKAVTEAQAAAQKDFQSGVRDTPLLLGKEKEAVEAAAGSFYDLHERIDQNRRLTEHWRETLTDGLADIALHFNSAGDAARQFFDQLAGQILKQKVTGPLANSIIGGLDSSGLFSGVRSLLGFADGGDPPVGVPSVVGERGPEIFVPRTAGTVIPNGAGGTSVAVYQTFNINAGVQGTVRKEILEAVPFIVAQSKAAVLQGVERGGPEARIVGKR
jgi:hypothetical protein